MKWYFLQQNTSVQKCENLIPNWGKKLMNHHKFYNIRIHRFTGTLKKHNHWSGSYWCWSRWLSYWHENPSGIDLLQLNNLNFYISQQLSNISAKEYGMVSTKMIWLLPVFKIFFNRDLNHMFKRDSWRIHKK